MKELLKLYLYDEKHEQILAEKAILAKEKLFLEEIITFLNDNGVLNRYKQLAICSYAEVKYDEDGEPTIEFTD
jgi:hypothetical protein